jgi:predicted RNA methylase
MKQFKNIEGRNSDKLPLDKYYTPIETTKYCINKTIEILKEKNCKIDSFLEPSAGQGVFVDYLRIFNKKIIAIDIEPEKEGIVKANFLEYPLEYEPNRLIIGNPPFGTRLNLAKKFFKKSILLGDYISFILPISQLNNSEFMYEFDLLYSENLGKVTFSDNKKVKCCLNIYIRPQNGLNEKKINKLKDVEIVRQDSKKFKKFECDIRICFWGNAIGKILKDGEKYAHEYKIKIHNDSLKEKIIDVFKSANWHKEINYTSTPTIYQHHIISLLKREIPEIK